MMDLRSIGSVVKFFSLARRITRAPERNTAAVPTEDWNPKCSSLLAGRLRHRKPGPSGDRRVRPSAPTQSSPAKGEDIIDARHTAVPKIGIPRCRTLSTLRDGRGRPASETGKVPLFESRQPLTAGLCA